MQVRVKLMRNSGHWLTVGQRAREFQGNLLSGNAGKNSDAIRFLYLLDGPSLYDSKIKDVFGTEISFVGIEKVEGAWVMQEWRCEILSLR